MAGLATAYDAWKLSLGDKPAKGGEQLFFLGFGQGWRNSVREAALRQQVATDSHAPAQFRTATVRNLAAWYAAFEVKPGQKLYLDPKDRVTVW